MGNESNLRPDISEVTNMNGLQSIPDKHESLDFNEMFEQITLLLLS